MAVTGSPELLVVMGASATSDQTEHVLARLAEQGIEPERPPFRPGDRPDLRVCFVVDPDGVRVELIDGMFAVPQHELPDGIS